MRNVTILVLTLLLSTATSSLAQQTDLTWSVANHTDLTQPYPTGHHSGARGVSGPYDTDGDGKVEVLVTDYTGGGRIHVLENVGTDTWELVWSAPFADSTSTSNARYAVGDADLDGDGRKEILFYTGAGYSATNPRVGDGTYKPGMWVFEHTGDDNSFGDLPAFICDFNQGTTFFIHEQFHVFDADGDGVQEILSPQNNSGSGADFFYVYSVAGTFEPNSAASTFATCVDELTLARGADGLFNFNTIGGGSPYAIIPADLDGDGSVELSLHAWFNFNFFNVDPTGPDTYALPDPAGPNPNLRAAPSDHVSLFGGVAVDINGDGDDEVFYPRYHSFGNGQVSILNYESGENVLQVSTDNLILDAISGLTNFGITAGDLDGDGAMELIGAGFGYTGSEYDRGEPSSWIRVAEFNGGDPEDGANYIVSEFDTSSPADTSHLSFVVRDSAGVKSSYHDRATGKFATKLAFLGDADGDGAVEVAVGFQSVADSVEVIDEVWNADSLRYERTVRERKAAPQREFMRILASDGYSVSVEDTKIVLPSDYQLHANYPNPFNPETTISFTLPLDKAISVQVYDVTGRLVKTIVDNQHYARGTHEVQWDGTNNMGAQVSSGTYLYTLTYGNFRQSRTMILLK